MSNRGNRFTHRLTAKDRKQIESARIRVYMAGGLIEGVHCESGLTVSFHRQGPLVRKIVRTAKGEVLSNRTLRKRAE